MTPLDWALLVVWLGVTLAGFWKGMLRIVFGCGGLVVGVWLAGAVGAEAASAMAPVVRLEWLAVVLGRLLPLLGCVLVAVAAGWGIERTLTALHLDWLNRVCGAVLAAGVAALLLGLALATAARLSPTGRDWCARSLLAPPLVRLWGLALAARDDRAHSTLHPVPGRGWESRSEES